MDKYTEFLVIADYGSEKIKFTAFGDALSEYKQHALLGEDVTLAARGVAGCWVILLEQDLD